MKEKEDREYFNAILLGETPKALRVETHDGNAGEYWIPKAVCNFRRTVDKGRGVLEVESWFARQEQML